MKIFTPATSANLGPGFDSLGLALKLYNETEIKKQNFFSISIVGYGDKSAKKNNQFVNIFNEVYSELIGKSADFKFSFVNKIPFSRGLGSSSSVIVGAIAAAYEMAGFKITKEAILNRAFVYEMHPDNIAPVVYGGFTANVVHEGKIYTQKALLDSDLRAVMVIPDKSMNTKESRLKLAKSFSMKDTVSNLSHAAFLTACFIHKDYKMLRIASIDKMHEDCRMSTFPQLFEVRKVAYNNGALMSSLSGSGSSFLNIIHKSEANKLKNSLQSSFPNFAVEIYEFDNDGFYIEN